MAEEKKYLSRIQLTNGTTVEIKDQEAREALDNLVIEADQIKSNQEYEGEDAEVWIFYCGTSTELV